MKTHIAQMVLTFRRKEKQSAVIKPNSPQMEETSSMWKKNEMKGFFPPLKMRHQTGFVQILSSLFPILLPPLFFVSVLQPSPLT